MSVSFNQENINFKLSSVEFSMNSNNAIFGGAIFCEVEDPALRSDLIARFHQYNEDGVKFNYKMEKKGYVEIKKRNLMDYSAEPGKSVEKEIASKIKLIFDGNRNMDCCLQTTPLSTKPEWTITLWSESKDLFDQLKKSISSL